VSLTRGATWPQPGCRGGFATDLPRLSLWRPRAGYPGPAQRGLSPLLGVTTLTRTRR